MCKFRAAGPGVQMPRSQDGPRRGGSKQSLLRSEIPHTDREHFLQVWKQAVDVTVGKPTRGRYDPDHRGLEVKVRISIAVRGCSG